MTLSSAAGPVHEVLAHKNNASGVLFTGYDRPGPGREFELRLAPGWTDHAEWISHSRPEVLFAEALRQAVIIFAHQAHSVPIGAAFIMERMVFKMLGPHADRSSRVVLRTAACEYKAERLVTLIAEFRFEHEGTASIIGEGHLRVVPETVYRRMRDGRSQSSQLARSREIPSGLSLFPTPSAASSVEYDPGHPLFFDHDVDHVPGMLLVSAAIAAFAETHPRRSLSVLDACFFDYLELDQSCTIPMTAAAIESEPHKPHMRVEFPNETGSAAVIEIYSASVTEAIGIE